MSKDDKKMGRLKPKHQPEPEDSKLTALRRKYRKRKARYVVEEWEVSRWRFWKSSWRVLGSSRQLHEAENIAQRQGWRYWVPLDRKARRIIDIEEGKVIATFGPPKEHAE